MTRAPHSPLRSGRDRTAVGFALTLAVALAAGGCTVAGPAAAGSTSAKASAFGSASAFTRLIPPDVFATSLTLLRERDDVHINDVDETRTRCTAVSGDRSVTLRVIDSGTGGSRLSILVGGGRDRGANQAFADELLTSICGRLPASCE